MANTPKIPLKPEEEENVVTFTPKLITGGKEPPEGSNWLDRIALGTVFLVRYKTNPAEYVLGLFRLMHKTDRSVGLQSPTVPHTIWVNPNRFCNVFDLHEDLGTLIEEETGGANDKGNRFAGVPGTEDPKVE